MERKIKTTFNKFCEIIYFCFSSKIYSNFPTQPHCSVITGSQARTFIGLLLQHQQRAGVSLYCFCYYYFVPRARRPRPPPPHTSSLFRSSRHAKPCSKFDNVHLPFATPRALGTPLCDYASSTGCILSFSKVCLSCHAAARPFLPLYI